MRNAVSTMPAFVQWFAHLKKVDAAIVSGDQANAQEAYTAAVPVIDRMADKGIIHKNKAARHKSRLNAKVKALSAA